MDSPRRCAATLYHGFLEAFLRVVHFMEWNKPLFVVGFEITAHLDPDAPADASRGETTTPSFISFPCTQEETGLSLRCGSSSLVFPQTG
mmetsp:Transcript_29932/g.34312  ORF Transcript_29932/g.34312 Transcript_29932/m.34312 type:complete len:89 (-) Transcript_29932:104-370(-)